MLKLDNIRVITKVLLIAFVLHLFPLNSAAIDLLTKGCFSAKQKPKGLKVQETLNPEVALKSFNDNRGDGVEKKEQPPEVIKTEEQPPEVIIKSQETLIAKEALKHYTENGVPIISNVCDYPSTKSNKMIADAICKYAIEKIYPRHSFQNWAKCEENVALYEQSYKEISIVGTQVYRTGAKCEYGCGKYFHIFNTPFEHSYYMIENARRLKYDAKNPPKIRAVLTKTVNKVIDDPPPGIRATLNFLEAENIYLFHGSIATKFQYSDNHLCEKKSSDFQLLDEKICEKAVRNTTYFKDVISKSASVSKPVCTPVIITTSGNGEMLVKPLGVKCSYRYLNTRTHFNVLNGPTPAFYYIVEDKTIQACVAIRS